MSTYTYTYYTSTGTLGMTRYSSSDYRNISLGYVGSEVDGSYSSRFLYTYQSAVQPFPIASSLTSSDVTLERMTIRVNGYSSIYGRINKFNIIMNIPQSTPANNSTSAEWNKWRTGTSVATLSVDSSTTQISANTTDASIIKAFLQRGMTFYPDATLSSSDEPIYDLYYKISSIVVTIEYKSQNKEPVVSGITADANNYEDGTSSICDPLTLRWNYHQESGSAQASIDIDIKDANDPDTEYRSIVSKYPLTGQHYTIQPSAYPAPSNGKNGDYYKFRLRAYSAAGVASDYVECDHHLMYPWPSDLAPGGGENRLSGSATQLRWSSSKDYQKRDMRAINLPTKFDIQYSINSGESWIDLVNGFTAEREEDTFYYDVPANTFPYGIITWRVRPWMNGYTVNNFTQESFIVRIQASTFSVTCDGKPRPTLSWTSSSQVAYHIRFADFDSGAMYGPETSYTLPYYYADGTYPVQIRTQAIDGTWSDWTELQYVTITNKAASGTVALSAAVSRHAVVLSWSTDDTYVNYILYRNSIPIYVGKNLTYTDGAAAGSAVYQVRGIAEDGYYTPSNAVTVNATPKNDCLYNMDSGIWIPLKYSFSARSRSYSHSVQTTYKYYAGRTKPVAFTENYSERGLSVSYAFKTRAEAEQIAALAGKTVIYKDTKGGLLIGILNDVNLTSERFYSISFTVTEIDYKEAVPYET